MLPNRWSSFAAVFCPIPGTPGILSDESPIRPRKSGICAGATPYFSSTIAGSNTTTSLMPFFVVKMRVCSLASWQASLSPVTSRTSQPSASARAATVPRISSPSQPGTLTTGMSIDSSRSSISGNCTRRSSSIGGRWALYSSIASMRNAGLPASNAHTIASGDAPSMNFRSMERKPKTAWVGVPSAAFMVGGTAWYARCISELPSITAMVLGMSVAFFRIHSTFRSIAKRKASPRPSEKMP